MKIEENMSRHVYGAVIRPSEDGGYWAEIPDLEGCFAQGKDYMDTIESISDGLETHLAALAEYGMPIPKANVVSADDGDVVYVYAILEQPQIDWQSNKNIAMTNYIYQAFLTPECEGGYSAEIPDLPGCYSEGDDFIEAIEAIADAGKTYISSLIKAGDIVPSVTVREIPIETREAWVCFEAGASYIA